MTTQRRKKPAIALQRLVELDERERQIRKDYQWVLQDGTIQRQQAGKVVAVHRRRIWGVGPNHAAALAAALERPECPSQQELALVYVEGQTIA
jgi:hypothetical protein